MKRLASSIKATNNTSIRGQNPLTNEVLKQYVPAIFATEAYHDRSKRYAFIPTIDIVERLRVEGFYPFFAAQATPRIEDKHNFAKYMMRFRQPNAITSKSAHEIIMCGSSDGTSSHQLLAGEIVWACANSHVVGSIIEDVRVRHSGNHATDNVIEGVYRVVNEFEKVDEHIERMNSITLSDREAYEFGKASLLLKYDSIEVAPVTPDRIIEPRRWEDSGSSLWDVFNRTQENLVRGGLKGLAKPNEQGKRRKLTTRPVNGITENVKLNQALWSLAEAMANIKEAA